MYERNAILIIFGICLSMASKTPYTNHKKTLLELSTGVSQNRSINIDALLVRFIESERGM